LDLLRADDAGVAVDFEVKKVLDLTGELWKSRTPDEDLDICFRPAETANGLRRMNAMPAEDGSVDELIEPEEEENRQREVGVVEEAREL
jgi:hypothetical protein